MQHQWMCGQVSVIVATVSFGMGVDKANVRSARNSCFSYVTHTSVPPMAIIVLMVMWCVVLVFLIVLEGVKGSCKKLFYCTVIGVTRLNTWATVSCMNHQFTASSVVLTGCSTLCHQLVTPHCDCTS